MYMAEFFFLRLLQKRKCWQLAEHKAAMGQLPILSPPLRRS